MRRIACLFFIFPGLLHAEELPSYKPNATELKEAYTGADRLVGGWNSKVFKMELTPHWIGNSGAFWYRNDLAEGERHFILIDSAKGTRRDAFDAAKLSEAVQQAGGPKLNPKKLPFDTIEFRDDLKKIAFQIGSERWIFEIATNRANKEEPAPKQKASIPTIKPAETEEISEQGEELASQPGGPRRGPNQPRNNKIVSPDGKNTVLIRDFNLFLKQGDGEEKPLTKDGVEKQYYGMVTWAPDSKKIVAQRIVPGDNKEVYFVESSPKEGGRAKLHSNVYPQPGDRFAEFEAWVFDLATATGKKIDAEKVDFHTPRVRWTRDGKHFTYEKTDRGHRRFRIIGVDTETAKSRSIFDEQAKTFVNQYANFTLVYLDETNEIIVSSERDGWNHLYLVDTVSGKMKNQITKGEFVVRGIEHIDHAKRTLDLRVCGTNKDQDPYFIHYYRVNFDGTGLQPLTTGNGTHTLKWSPNRSYFVDTWSRVDSPPVHELRNGLDGKLVCQLESADISQLKATSWKAPEVFVAKGRDNKTDIWGMITRPTHFDPKKKYPIIEYIYAGPHDSFVPKSFRVNYGKQALAEFGFIVVQCDGMGTLNRSKAFHDVCWQNVGDAGFPDRIAWIKSLAAKYPQADLSQVGIYGTSAGGQSSTGALLFHSDFYKVAVSSCGCHDNRMDKSSWNEQWMGVPVGPHYEAQSNITNAKKLKGKLFLIVGEMDTNVPPESTYRLADALIKAKKEFDFLMVPGMGHSDGGSYGERRRRDFFVRHLLGVQTPDWNVVEK